MLAIDSDRGPQRTPIDLQERRAEKTAAARRGEITPSGARLLDRLYAAVGRGDRATARPLLDQALSHKGIPTSELRRSAFDFNIDEGEKELAKKASEDLVGPGFLDKVRGAWWAIKKSYTDVRDGLEPKTKTINTWADVLPAQRSKLVPELYSAVSPTFNLPPKPRLRPISGGLPVGWRIS